MTCGVTEIEIRHFHLCCGVGGGARGFNRGRAQVGPLRAKFRCIGGVDVDPEAIRDFEKLDGVRGTVLDLFDREQFANFLASRHRRTGEKRHLKTSGELPETNGRTSCLPPARAKAIQDCCRRRRVAL